MPFRYTARPLRVRKLVLYPIATAPVGEGAAVFCFSTLMREYPSEYGYKPTTAPWRCLRRRHIAHA